MQPQLYEVSDEINTFIIEGTYRLATISINDYGYLLSARMAQTYMVRALQVLDAKRGFDRPFYNEVSLLKACAGEITREYAQFETFCNHCERFDHLETKNWIEWLSKCLVRVKSSGHRATVSHLLAYKLRTFHSRLSSVLTGR